MQSARLIAMRLKCMQRTIVGHSRQMRRRGTLRSREGMTQLRTDPRAQCISLLTGGLAAGGVNLVVFFQRQILLSER